MSRKFEHDQLIFSRLLSGHFPTPILLNWQYLQHDIRVHFLRVCGGEKSGVMDAGLFACECHQFVDAL
jgi:hypothetical protein